MKKILISVLIILLIVLAYFAIFQGLSLGTLNILSINQIIESNDSLTNKIAETNSLLKKDYPSKKETLLSEVSTLLEKKEEYFNIAKVSTEGELSKANTEETYTIEYLWTRVGRYSRFKGVNVNMIFTSSNTGEQNMQNLGFTVTGQYVGIIEFIYALEDDSELNFKIENFKMVPNGNNLTATFNVTNIRVKTERTTTSSTSPQSTSNPNSRTGNSSAQSSNTDNTNNNNNLTTNEISDLTNTDS